MSLANPARTTIFVFHAIAPRSMAIIPSMPSFLQLKTPISIRLLRLCLAQAVTLDTMLSVMDVTKYVTCPCCFSTPANRCSIFMVSATSALIVLIGITAQLALSTLVSSILVIDLYLYMSLLTILRLCQARSAIRHVIMASIAMDHSAPKAVALSHTSKVIDTNVLFATTPTSVPVVRLIHLTHTTKHILSSNLGPLFATSPSQPWEIMRMVDLCQ